ncbi:CotS family spore coat protein [Clostridium saccharoperbutylacetonicum]|uniref:CotS family spore coat protein n=1 Tax=Clostridium saccharoperbutylacetonicum TaxID=36745 RepID=UPI000983C5F2|nr:CotS family spore coat protein [Clostridium saccharoperbutylacetonicum]AQR93241.1 spore coat protein I [Clostridium saccharoperbutylacetonicum]NSB34658.1 CotS family spore coat protein [Clostridium saccharoperbutylacetonicum]
MENSKEILKIKGYIEENYSLDIENIEKVKNSYKIITKDNKYCLKMIKYEFPHFYFILSAIKHLQRNGFINIPSFIMNKEKSEYGCINGKYVYLTKWIPSRESNYDNPLELAMVASALSKLHKCSKGFTLGSGMKPRIGWFSWLKVFETRKNEILDFKNRINQKAYKSDFDLLYLGNIEAEIKRAEKSIAGLQKNNYVKLMEKEVFERGFCHHDYAHHNILIDSSKRINIIDFDYCILDSHLHDLGSLLIRTMKEGKWEMEKADLIFKSYKENMEVSKEELPIIREFIRFPQAFWQIGLQVYWEQQPWGEEFFINKLVKYLEDRGLREKFIDSYFVGGN